MVMLGLALAAVMRITTPVAVDGRLDEPVWKDASWNGDFSRLMTQASLGAFARPTEFAVLADEHTLYVGIRCFEPNLARLQTDLNRDLWRSDSVELFCCPTGAAFDFYHFGVSPVSPARYSVFASEGGAIRPDPYAPTWRRACAFEKDAWTVEIAIPFSSFYMTRNADWSGEWLLNVTRTYREPVELASWSVLEAEFGEPKRFRKFAGFPRRAEADDFAATDIQSVNGALELVVTTAVPGEYVAEVPEFGRGPVKLTLAAGRNRVRIPTAYPRSGRFVTHLKFVRPADGTTFERDCPVVVDIQPVRVRLTSPQYRNCFYPGQEAARVAGTVETLDGGDATVTLEGPGFPVRTATVASGGAFEFDVRGFRTGDARLTVKAAGGEKTVKVRNLPPSGRQMVWIEDGHLVVDGKPVLRRNLYAEFYKGGRKFDAKYRRELSEFHTTPAFARYVDIQPDRLVPGLERKEAIRDVRPSPAYFAKLDEAMKKYADTDFGYYYLIDEPECRELSSVYLRHIYDYVAERDPYHPILTASRGGKAYVECVDWAETHPYLSARNQPDGTRMYGTPPWLMGDHLDAFEAWDRPDKVIGYLPTCFAYRWSSSREDYPTFDEYVLHAWAAMSHGGKSLWPYAYHDLGDRPALYEGTKYLFESFEALTDPVLFGRRTVVRSDADARVVLYSTADDRMLVALNYTKRDLEVGLPDAGRKLREFRGTRTVDGGRIVLRPFETFVATALPHDAGLRPFAAVAADVAAAERARTSRDNQLLERYDDLTCEANFSGSHANGFYKLVDGMYDQLAKASTWKDDAWWRFDFRKGWTPTFDRLVVHGSGIFDRVEASVFADGAWRKLPAVRREKTDDYRVVVEFGRPVTAERLRLDFPGEKGQRNELELYEIELPKESGR